MSENLHSLKAPTRIVLVGGLGNQLFGFFAGQYLIKVAGIPVEYIQARAALHFSGFRSSIHDLKIHGTELIVNSKLKTLGARVSKQLSAASLPPRVKSEIFKVIPESFISSGIGFEERLAHVEPGCFVHGYFQTYKYLREIEVSEGPLKFELKAESQWYKEMRRRVESTDPIIMHVRRGDYKKLADSFGILGTDYYLKALDALGDNHSTRPIWIFSDEANSMSESILLGKDREFVWVNQEGAQSAAEVLSLMSQASTTIISNSTFSWWSAMLGTEKTVVAPSKWFKIGEDPKDLVPPNWLKADTFWE